MAGKAAEIFIKYQDLSQTNLRSAVKRKNVRDGVWFEDGGRRAILMSALDESSNTEMRPFVIVNCRQ